MNRLDGMRCYTAGPMDYYNHGLAKHWRKEISEFLAPKGVLVLSPLDKPSSDPDIAESEEDKQKLTRLKDAGDFDEVRRIMKKVCRMDLRMVDCTDFLIGQVDTNVHMCGTYHEIFMASLQRKPTILFVEGGKANAPNWIYGIVPHELIFGSLDEVKDYLTYIDTLENTNDVERWFFFDKDKMQIHV